MEPRNIKYELARKRVKNIKDFYGHLTAYLVVNVFLLLMRGNVLHFLEMKIEGLEVGFYEWFNLNMLLTPAIWGLALAAHALYVFQFKIDFFKKWETNQIRKYMAQEEKEAGKFQ